MAKKQRSRKQKKDQRLSIFSNLIFLIYASIGNCIVLLVGQNYGGKKFERVSEIQTTFSQIALIASETILVIVLTLSTPIIKLFSTEFQVIRYTYIYLYSLSEVFDLIYIILTPKF